MQSWNLYASCFLMLLASVSLLGYAARVWLKGRAVYARVEQEGGSKLLGKGMMESFYWTLSPVARALLRLRVTPNALTWASSVFGIFSGILMAFGHFGGGAVAAATAGLLDGLDGLVARLSGVGSEAGGVLDSTMDRYVEFFFLAGLAIHYQGSVPLQGLALSALLGSFMVSYSSAKCDQFRMIVPRGSMRRAERTFYLSLGAALSPFSIALLEFPSIGARPLGYPMILALAVVAVVSNINALQRSAFLVRSLAERDRLERLRKESAEKSGRLSGHRRAGESSSFAVPQA